MRGQWVSLDVLSSRRSPTEVHREGHGGGDGQALEDAVEGRRDDVEKGV